jgi:hypothetical protein
MVRWLGILLLAGCLRAQGSGAPAAPQQTTEQAPATKMATPGQAAIEPPSAEGKATADHGAAVLLKPEDFPLNRFRDFSAIMVGSLLPGDQRERHIYRSGNLFRAETLQGLSYMVTDLSKMQTFGLARTGCIVDNHPYLADFPFTEGQPDRKFESVLRGKETVDGHECRIEEVTISGGGLPKPMYLRFWEAEDLNGFPIKVQVMKGPNSVIQYRNVVVQPQDPTLFMHPNSCKKGLPELPAKLPTPPPRPKSPSVSSPAPDTSGSSQK